MTLPTDLPSALSMLGELVHDDRLALGLQTVGVVLLLSYVITWGLLKVTRR
jgi:hypothetical protein